MAKALSEYKSYLAKYYQWEAEGGEQPMRPVPLRVHISDGRTRERERERERDK